MTGREYYRDNGNKNYLYKLTKDYRWIYGEFDTHKPTFIAHLDTMLET